MLNWNLYRMPEYQENSLSWILQMKYMKVNNTCQNLYYMLHQLSTYISPRDYGPRIDTVCDTDFAMYYSLFYQGDDSITSHSYT